MEPRSGAHLLVVDDDPDQREALQDLLELAGFIVATAANGAQALEYVAREQPDLVIMDLAMPVLDGWNAQKLMRAGRNSRHVPVMLLSGHTSESDRQKFVDAGFVDVMSKPFSVERLIDRVQAVLRGAENAGGRN